MIFPEVSSEEWSKRYPGLTPRSTECKHCGKEHKTSIPYITKDYAGFIIFKCIHCGGDHTAHVGRPISVKEIEAWNKLV